MFQTSLKARTEKTTVINRRQQEDRVNFLNSKLKQEFHMKELAKFENRGKDVAKHSYGQKRLSELREEYTRKLERKREELAMLLSQENEEYKNQIKNLEETPEQVKERMFNRVQELREKKEKERKLTVEEKLERRFRESTDELRKAQSQNYEALNQQMLLLQMKEKQLSLEQNYQSEMIYAELWNREKARKEKKEMDELLQKKVKNEEKNGILSWQVTNNQKARQDEVERLRQEKLMLNEQWEAENKRQQLLEMQRAEANKQRNQEITEYNTQQKTVKEEFYRSEKLEDKEMIKNLVEIEKLKISLEQQARENQRKEAREAQLNYKTQTIGSFANEAELDRLVNEENERQMKKRLETWQKEEESRIKLMHEVYDSRAKDVYRKKELSKLETKNKEIEKEQVMKDILDYEQEVRKKKEQEALVNARHQEQIINQISQKKDVNRQRIQEKMEEEKAALLAEVERRKKIQEEIEKGRIMLDGMKRQRPFQR